MRTVIFSLLSIFLLISVINSTRFITPYSGSEVNPICPSSSTLELDANDMRTNSENVLDFDFKSTYNTSEGDSAQLFIKKGSLPQTNFKFFSSADDVFTSFNVAECTGTANAQIHKILNEIIIVKDGNGYKLCRFDGQNPTMSFAAITLTVPSTIGDSATQIFLPYFFQRTESLLYVSMSSSGVFGISQIYSYHIPQIASAAINPVATMATTNRFITSIQGNNRLVYLNQELFMGSFSNLNEAAQGTFPVLPGFIWNFHYLRANRVILATRNADATQGSMHVLNGATLQLAFNFEDQPSAFSDYCDDLSNFVRVGSATVSWYHLQKTGTTELITSFPRSQITSDSILNIALSGDKAVVMLSDRLIYLKHVATQNIKKVLQTSTTSLTLTGDYQYNLLLSCMCPGVESFSCFSSTLSCLIVRIAGQVCLTRDPFITAAQ